MGEPGKEFESFGSKDACEHYRTLSIRDAQKKLLNAPSGIENMRSETQYIGWTYLLGTLHIQCIASDDPRLKEK